MSDSDSNHEVDIIDFKPGTYEAAVTQRIYDPFEAMCGVLRRENTVLKSKVAELEKYWAWCGLKKKTPKGNIAKPSCQEVINWISKARTDLDEEMVKRSFKVCGITSVLSGSEDDIITRNWLMQWLQRGFRMNVEKMQPTVLLILMIMMTKRTTLRASETRICLAANHSRELRD